MSAMNYWRSVTVFCVMLVATYGVAAGERVGVEPIVGFSSGSSSGAIDGFDQTEFTSGSAIGGRLRVTLDDVEGVEIGYGRFEVEVYRYKTDLEENSENFGTLTVTPVMLNFKVGDYVGRKDQVAFFFGIGGGPVFGSFEEGPFLKETDAASGVTTKVETDLGFAFMFGGGSEIMLSKVVSLTVDLQITLSSMGTTWTISGPGGTAEVPEIEDFSTTGFQVLAGLTVWFPSD